MFEKMYLALFLNELNKGEVILCQQSPFDMFSVTKHSVYKCHCFQPVESFILCVMLLTGLSLSLK